MTEHGQFDGGGGLLEGCTELNLRIKKAFNLLYANVLFRRTPVELHACM